MRRFGRIWVVWFFFDKPTMNRGGSMLTCEAKPTRQPAFDSTGRRGYDVHGVVEFARQLVESGAGLDRDDGSRPMVLVNYSYPRADQSKRMRTGCQACAQRMQTRAAGSAVSRSSAIRLPHRSQIPYSRLDRRRSAASIR